MKMSIGIALLVGGIVLLVLGFQAKGSLEDKVTETFSGHTRDRTTLMLVGGAAATAAGLGLLVFKGKKSG